MTGPAGSHSSNVLAEPTFRTQTWNQYEPATGGIQRQDEEALQSCPSVQLEPLFTQNR